MSADVAKLVAAILAAALSSKNDTPSKAKDYVDTYESVLEVLEERERSRDKEKRSAAEKNDSWTKINEELKRKKGESAGQA
jgi:hypothetical protein